MFAGIARSSLLINDSYTQVDMPVFSLWNWMKKRKLLGVDHLILDSEGKKMDILDSEG